MRGPSGEERLPGQGARRRPLVAWLTIVLGLAAALGLLLGGQQLAYRVPIGSLAGQLTAFYVILFAPLVALALLLGRVEQRRVLRPGRRPLRWGALGLVTGVGGLATCVAYVALHGALRKAPPGEALAAGLFALGLAITVLQVLAEEALFRGWLLPAIGEQLGAWAGVLLSAAAFSAFHMVGGAVEAVSFVNLMLGGIWFALLAWRSGGILAPFAAHYGWNVAEDMGLGLVPNPGRGDFGVLLDRDIAGPVVWGGSQEGLNASWPMSVVLIALILPLLAPPRRD